MPSGPPELHDKWKNDTNAINFLENKGYILTRRFEWLAPKRCFFPPYHTAEENSALDYLIYEWDYGDVVGGIL